MKALVVDDDAMLADVVGFTLRREGFEVEVVHDGAAALARWREAPPDLIVLDVNLPKVDGFTVCRRIRAEDDATPILLLTVREEEDDIVHGLRIGADDYITKPFSPRQLVARAQTVLRRAGKTPSRAIRRAGDLLLASNSRELTCGSCEGVALTRLENRLLDYLMLNHGRIISAEVLIDYVWPDGGDRDMLRQLIRRVRAKVTQACCASPESSEDAYIQNVPGLGYGLLIPELERICHIAITPPSQQVSRTHAILAASRVQRRWCDGRCTFVSTGYPAVFRMRVDRFVVGHGVWHDVDAGAVADGI